MSVWNQTMTWGRLGAQVTTQSSGGAWHNGHLVFDCVDSENYKCAGMEIESNRWVIEEVVVGTHYVCDEEPDATLEIGHMYNVLIEVTGNTAMLKVGGVTKASHTFASGIHGGKVGLHVYAAHAHFKEVAIKVPVNVTFSGKCWMTAGLTAPPVAAVTPVSSPAGSKLVVVRAPPRPQVLTQ